MGCLSHLQIAYPATNLVDFKHNERRLLLGARRGGFNAFF
jgi:hypothetical protein